MKQTDWTLSVINEAQTRYGILRNLTQEEMEELLRYVILEAEAWDGEPVEIRFAAEAMANRYKAVGLVPSRN